MTMDLEILHLIQGLRTPLLDGIMVVLTTMGDGGIVWIALSIVLLIIPKTRRCGLAIALGMLLSHVVGNVVLKPILARPRPFSVDPSVELIVKAPSSYSFPSGHTFASFASATALFLFHRKEGIAACILAAVIAFSRMYFYVHFPTDILAGIILGIASGFTAFKLISWYQNRYQPRWLKLR